MANGVNVNGKVTVPAKEEKKNIPFSLIVKTDAFKGLVNRTLNDPKRIAGFTTSIVSTVTMNPQLSECDPWTIVSAGLLGESLNLSSASQLGQFYIVPFKDNKNHRTVAQFQLGYKGYIQLAIRSGQYRKLNAMAIKEGELIKYDPLNEDIEVQLIENEADRDAAPTIGYYAMFEYLNGFKKAIYWSKEKMEAHAKTYSFAYRAGYGSSFWLKDFDSMAIKTMLRQLISKWGVMSVEFQKAYEADMGAIKEDGTIDYIDNVPDVDIPEAFEVEAETEEESK